MRPTSLAQVTWLVIATACAALGLAGSVHYGPEITKTTASSSDYSVSYGGTEKYNRNYEFYYYGGQFAPRPVAPTPTPFVSVGEQIMQTKAPVIGYVKPYSDVQYSQIVLQQINADRVRNGAAPVGVAPVAQQQSAGSAAVPPPTPVPSPAAATAVQSTPVAPEKGGIALLSAMITNLYDRGVMLTSNGEALRLRGVAFPSIKSKHEDRRKIAGAVMAGLHQLVAGQKIYYMVEKPEKGLDGNTLAIVHLADGTELNRLALESGMAVMNPSEFASEEEADRLIEAERNARKARRGFWANE